MSFDSNNFGLINSLSDDVTHVHYKFPSISSSAIWTLVTELSKKPKLFSVEFIFDSYNSDVNNALAYLIDNNPSIQSFRIEGLFDCPYSEEEDVFLSSIKRSNIKTLTIDARSSFSFARTKSFLKALSVNRSIRTLIILAYDLHSDLLETMNNSLQNNGTLKSFVHHLNTSSAVLRNIESQLKRNIENQSIQKKNLYSCLLPFLNDDDNDDEKEPSPKRFCLN